MGLPKAVKDEMGIAGAESHITGTIFICLAKVIDQHKLFQKFSFCFICASIKWSAAYFNMQA